MRKHQLVIIDAEGRDKGKAFLVLEKSAFDTEKWATRALLAMGRAGVQVEQDVLQAGALGLLLIGLQSLQRVPFEDAEPLLDEMMTCFSFVPDVSKKDALTGAPIGRPLVDGDIEEVATLLKLREAAIETHLGFSIRDSLSSLGAFLNSNQRDTSTSPPSAEQ